MEHSSNLCAGPIPLAQMYTDKDWKTAYICVPASPKATTTTTTTATKHLFSLWPHSHKSDTATFVRTFARTFSIQMGDKTQTHTHTQNAAIEEEK